MPRCSPLRLSLSVLFIGAAILISAEPGFADVLGWFLSRGNRLHPAEGAPDTRVIRIHPPEELDFLTKDEVFKRRIAAVQEEQQLVDGEYYPARKVFGGITGGRPWWGLDGVYLYGPGKEAPEGPADESRSILNPFLLVGLIESNAFIVRPPPPEPHDFYPQPIFLELNLREQKGRVRYDMSRFISFLKQIGSNTLEKRLLDMVGLNARDFGFRYFWVDNKRSSGAYWPGPVDEPEPLRQYVHLGANCRVPGGCNNMSPEQLGMHISLYRLPAKIALKLWYQKPGNVAGPADFRFDIEIVDLNGEFDPTKISPLE